MTQANTLPPITASRTDRLKQDSSRYPERRLAGEKKQPLLMYISGHGTEKCIEDGYEKLKR